MPELYHTHIRHVTRKVSTNGIIPYILDASIACSERVRMSHFFHQNSFRFIFLSGLLTVNLLFMCLIAAPSVFAAAIAQNFQIVGSSSDMVAGAIVGTSKKDARTVELANQQSANRTVGVVSSAPLISLSDGKGSVKVVTSGITSVLVSDINGSISTGDKITASPLSGIGMVATADTQVIGVAKSDFNIKSGTKRTVTDRDGTKHTIYIGQIPLQTSISFYQAPASKYVPPFIQSLANGIAGHSVSLVRVLFACLILILTFGSTAILVYSSIRSSIVSIGRNPLAANVINRGLVHVGFIGLGVIFFGLIATYLLIIF